MPKPALLLPLLLLASCAAAAPDPAPLERGGVSLVEAGRHTEAESLLQAALASTERRLGSGHRDVAVALGNLARLYEAEGRHAEATPLLRRAVAIREAGFGPDHPELAESLAELARSYADQGRYGEAVEAIRRAAKVRRVSVVTEGALRAGGTGAAAPPLGRDAVSARYVSVGWRLAEREPGRRSAMLDETFRAGQQVQARDVAAAVARVAARTAAGGDAALAPLVRDWLALVERRRGLDRALVEAAGRETPARIWERRLGERLQTLASLRRELAGTIAHLNALNARLAKSFPEYRELTSPVPAGVAEVQGLLAPDEALLAYAVLETGEGGAEEVFLWVVRGDRAEMYRLDLAPGELADGVRVLRDQLDPGRWAGDAPPKFDVALAHKLHAKLLPADATLLEGVRHLLVVPDGPLESLPLGVLVRAEPAPDAGYREVDWLARAFATTTLPSVSSLRVLRRVGEPSRAVELFRGVGDPILAGAGEGVAVPRLLSRGLADPAQVRALPPLPETAGELRTLARDLGAGEGSLLLRERATETAIKAGVLSGARVIAFATHAGVAGELPGLAEPALVLTPPARASETDDGLLTVSEAAGLRLDADLVVLSACNTAAPDGTPGAAGLSGLAKAFVHAGSRSLLVSHWAVLSDAAERLTTGMFAELAREPGLGRSEALRRSMLALLDGSGRENLLAHPAAWAPFVLVGEGGAPRPAKLAGASG